MRFVIIGAGDVGISLSQKLTIDQHDVVLVDNSERKLANIPGSLDVQTMLGNGCSPEILIKAGLSTADYVIAVANIDEVNISACLIAKMINPGAKRVARVRKINLVHSEIGEARLKDFFDLIINPEEAAADYLLNLFSAPGCKELISFANGKIQMVGIGVSSNAPVINTRLDQLKKLEIGESTLIIGIVRGHKLIIPRGQDRLRPGDIIYALTKPERVDTIFKLAGKALHKSERAMIWGGSGLGKSLAVGLENEGMSVKMIVSDQGMAQSLADQLRKTLILTGDGKDHNLLQEENIQEIDAFIAVTNDDEDNILSSLLAKRLGARMSMALVNKASYLPLVSAIGVDVVVSSRLAAATAILQHVHSETIIAEFPLRNFGAGFIEIDVTDEMPFIDTPISELRFPNGIIIGAVVRDEEVIIPYGETRLQPGDRVVIFVRRTAVKKLESILNLKLDFFT